MCDCCRWRSQIKRKLDRLHQNWMLLLFLTCCFCPRTDESCIRKEHQAWSARWIPNLCVWACDKGVVWHHRSVWSLVDVFFSEFAHLNLISLALILQTTQLTCPLNYAGKNLIDTCALMSTASGKPCMVVSPSVPCGTQRLPWFLMVTSSAV